MPDFLPFEKSNILGERLREARRLAGLSTRAVAEALKTLHKLSHVTISNFERGIGVPSVVQLSALASVYGRPIQWFLDRGRTLSNVHYRHLPSRVKPIERLRLEAESLRWLEAYDKLEHFLDKPLHSEVLHKTDVVRHLSSGREAAEGLRGLLRLADTDPGLSLADTLTEFGIRAMEMPTEVAVDGFAARFGGDPVVILNPRVANDRSRMNAAHELAHILFGDCDGGTEPSKAAEERAYELASHLILPESQLKEAFKGQSMHKLLKYKERFGISLAAMIYRASKAGILSEEQTRWFWIQFSQRGWKKNEPGQVLPDRANRFESLLDAALNNGMLTWRAAASLLGVREDELKLRTEIVNGDGVRQEGDERPTIPF